MFSPLVDELIESLKRLPSVGPKSAQRMALHLLQQDRDAAQLLSKALSNAAEQVSNCKSCRNLTEQEYCDLCASTSRDSSLLCVVEAPADVVAIEQGAGFSGKYFVLMGHLSPLDGVGPDDLGMDVLEQRFASGDIGEVILATNPTVEGETTAHYIGMLAKQYDLPISRIAYGVPMGGELEYVDGSTLAHSFASRQRMI